MRIAHIIWALGTGGAETMLVDIVNAQVESETVALYIINDYIEKSLLRKVDSRCMVQLIGRKPGSRSLLPWAKLNISLIRYRPNIIHFHLEGIRRQVFTSVPTVFTIHNIWTSGKEYPKYQALFAISDGVKNHTKEQGFEAITVWNGIRTKDILFTSKDSYHPGRTCRIICVGRLFTQHKGQDILVDALGVMYNQGISNFQLDLIGDGESRDELEKQVKKLGLEDRVTFLGQRDRSYIYEHLCEYDLFVLPSRSEGFGLTVAEAMCAKVPVIVCDLEGALDVIDGGRLGRQFKTGDVQSLAEQIMAFMNEGAEGGQVQEARQFAIDNFDIRRTALRYIEEYKNIIES